MACTAPAAELDLSELFGSLNVAAKEHAHVEDTAAAMTVELRDYQSALLADADRLFRGGQRAVLAYLPTGGGKTRVGAAAMAEWALNTERDGARCLFVVNRRSLLTQTRAALLELGFAADDVGLIGGGEEAALGFREPRVDVAMVQSLHERYLAEHEIGRYSLAIIDECHAAAAPSYLRLLGALPADGRVLGLTATPFRTAPDESLAAIFPAAAWGPSVSRLIERRLLVRPVIYGPKMCVVPPKAPDGWGACLAHEVDARLARAGAASDGESPPGGSSLCRTNSSNGGPPAAATRDADRAQLAAALAFLDEAVDCWVRRGGGARTVAFCPSVDASRALAKRMCARGISAEHLDGSSAPEVRVRTLSALRDGSVRVVCNVDVLSEGFDEPLVGCVLLMRHTHSPRVYVQQVGRALRVAPGKTRCVILDMVGATWKHGPLTGPLRSDYNWEAAVDGSGGAGAGGRGKGKGGSLRALVRRCECGALLHRDLSTCIGCEQADGAGDLSTCIGCEQADGAGGGDGADDRQKAERHADRAVGLAACGHEHALSQASSSDRSTSYGGGSDAPSTKPVKTAYRIAKKGRPASPPPAPLVDGAAPAIPMEASAASAASVAASSAPAAAADLSELLGTLSLQPSLSSVGDGVKAVAASQHQPKAATAHARSGSADVAAAHSHRQPEAARERARCAAAGDDRSCGVVAPGGARRPQPASGRGGAKRADGGGGGCIVSVAALAAQRRCQVTAVGPSKVGASQEGVIGAGHLVRHSSLPFPKLPTTQGRGAAGAHEPTRHSGSGGALQPLTGATARPRNAPYNGHAHSSGDSESKENAAPPSLPPSAKANALHGGRKAGDLESRGTETGDGGNSASGLERPSAEGLGKGWVVAWSERRCNWYYFNTRTNERQWARPDSGHTTSTAIEHAIAVQ